MCYVILWSLNRRSLAKNVLLWRWKHHKPTNSPKVIIISYRFLGADWGLYSRRGKQLFLIDKIFEEKSKNPVRGASLPDTPRRPSKTPRCRASPHFILTSATCHGRRYVTVTHFKKWQKQSTPPRTGLRIDFSLSGSRYRTNQTETILLVDHLASCPKEPNW